MTTDELDGNKGGNSKVSVTTVALFTLAMAAATGLGALAFFFVELGAQWAGICNGMAAVVMLAASFVLIQEGRDHGSGSWVVMGILTGGIFILLCKKVMIMLRRRNDVTKKDMPLFMQYFSPAFLKE